MDDRARMKRLLVLACVAAGVAAMPEASQAAYFTQTPPDLSTSGVGSFTWAFESSSDHSGDYGWTAYKLDTESNWHRCQKSGQATLSNLADGTYGIAIADDVNVEWAFANGLGYSGFTAPCSADPPAAPGTSQTTDSFVVDSTPPALGTPQVTTNGKTAQVTLSASDATTGIAGYQWVMGDGTRGDTTSPFFTHTYLSYGSYTGQVIATDNAGNSSSRDFSVYLKAPDTSAPTTFFTKHPPQSTHARHVTFGFASNDPNASFGCLYAVGWGHCSSPQKFRVKPGRYAFKVRATDRAGNTDRTPAQWAFRVKP